MLFKSVFISGCNRGIGLELVKRLADQTDVLFASCRVPSQAKELNDFAAEHKNVTVIELDITDQSAIDSAQKQVAEIVGDQGLTCLINNAAQATNKDKTMEDVTAELLKKLYEVNVVGVVMLTKSFLPLLKKASSLRTDHNMCISRAAILNISSKCGSIDDNGSARLYGYRLSKAAMNMFTKNLSIELKADHILAVSLHPGWVQTDMGGPNALITTETSAQGMINVISKFDEQHNGLFYAWDGAIIKW